MRLEERTTSTEMGVYSSILRQSVCFEEAIDADPKRQRLASWNW
jgi:hypothetical protein